MGTYIKMFVEKREAPGKPWERQDPPEDMFRHCFSCNDEGFAYKAGFSLEVTGEKCRKCGGTKNEPADWYEGQGYDTFAILADVRNGSHGRTWKPISKPRGIPKDLSADLRHDFIPEDDGSMAPPYARYNNGETFGHSWLTLKELLADEQINEENCPWLAGKTVPAMKKLGGDPENIRIVFCFE